MSVYAGNPFLLESQAKPRALCRFKRGPYGFLRPRKRFAERQQIKTTSKLVVCSDPRGVSTCGRTALASLALRLVNQLFRFPVYFCKWNIPRGNFRALLRGKALLRLFFICMCFPKISAKAFYLPLAEPGSYCLQAAKKGRAAHPDSAPLRGQNLAPLFLR